MVLTWELWKARKLSGIERSKLSAWSGVGTFMSVPGIPHLVNPYIRSLRLAIFRRLRFSTLADNCRPILWLTDVCFVGFQLTPLELAVNMARGP
jgi:hypothetical protein